MTIRQAKRYLRISNLVVIGFLVLLLAFNSIYIIEEQEQAVVVTFGKPSIVSTPGPHIKIPFFQDVEIVPMVINSFSIGYEGSREDSIYSESMMITSDYNFVNVDFFLEYQVSDPERYLFASHDPEFILRNMALSYIRDTIGLHTVDEVITTGKNEIQAEIKEKLTNRLTAEDIGLQLINITIQDSEPPTDEVKDAFKNVETAKQGKETAINTAMKYESEQVPAARAQEDAILKSAEAQKEARINEALGQVAVFNAMYEEYQKNPLMTKHRMFYETMEDVLPGMKIIIDSGDGTTSKVLPLESFTGGGTASGSSGPAVQSPASENEEEAS
ncbi:MAG: FtsH protease activity modulator HflK [Oscillospiraceae bacterium]|jgi:membrane protease subunit HflK|nr:FtsH protease activity modulator HflK [Oscillospiraceae bacterium]